MSAASFHFHEGHDIYFNIASPTSRHVSSLLFAALITLQMHLAAYRISLWSMPPI